MSYLKDLRADRKKAMAEMSTIIARGQLSNADRERFDSLKLDVGSIDNRISSLVNGVPDDRGRMPGRKRAERTERNKAFSAYLRSGDTRGVIPVYDVRSDGPGFSSAPNDAGTSAGPTGNYGGYMVAPAFWKNLQVALKAYGGLQNDFRQVETETGAPTPWPTIDPTNVTASAVASELTQLSIQNLYLFGQGMLNAWPYSVGPVLASLQLINDSSFDVDSFVADRFGEALGRQLASLGVSGTGNGQPLGIVPALQARGAVSTSGGFYQLTAGTTVKTFSASAPTELVGNLLSPVSLLG